MSSKDSRNIFISLYRFDFSRGLGVKLGTSIDYGEYLDIRPYTSDKSVSDVSIWVTSSLLLSTAGSSPLVSPVCCGGASRLLCTLRALHLLCEEL